MSSGEPQASRNTSCDLSWYFAQVKGAPEEEVAEAADLISTVEWDATGELFATGDKGGRVVVFRRDHSTPPTQSSVVDTQSSGGGGVCEFSVYSTFQSHEPEFDYLKSLEIEEKINKIRWLPKGNRFNCFLLSTNDKTVKLWKLSERDRKPDGFNVRTPDAVAMDTTSSLEASALASRAAAAESAIHTHVLQLDSQTRARAMRDLVVPRYVPTQLCVEASLRRIFANAHAYHINSIAVNSDQMSFLSADDLRINLWHLDFTDQSFNIVDMKPPNMEDLTEVITAAEFHPSCCGIFAFASSKGTVRLCDMRVQALCDKHVKLFEEPEEQSARSFFSEIITSISDIKFSHNGRYFLTRDYLTLKVWDLAMERRPIETYLVHEPLRAKLCALYENDCIFDKFECAWSANDRLLVTGSYNNFFRVFERETHRETTFEASRLEMHPGVQLHARRIVAAASAQAGAAGTSAGGTSTPGSTPSGSPALGKKGKKGPSPLGANAAAGGGVAASAMEVEQQAPVAVSVESLNLARKILHLACHPGENILAVAATNNLYIFQNPSGSIARLPGSGSASGCGGGALALEDSATCGGGAGRRCGSRHGSRSNSLASAAATQSGHAREHSPVSRVTTAAATASVAGAGAGAGAGSGSASGSTSTVFNAMHSRPIHEPEPMSIP